MATDVMLNETKRIERPQRPAEVDLGSSLPESVREVLKPLASLKLTVALFALAIVLVFTGTLAQARHDIWWVLHNYFRTPVAWIEFNVFFPPAWFADYPNLVNLGGSFPFPGGFTIGLLMAVNLLAAHALRFKVQTVGARLWAGLGVIALGCVLTWLVIAAGPDTDGSQATAPVDWLTLWRLFLIGIACVCGGIAAALFSIAPERRMERIVLGSVGTLLLGVLAYLLFGIDAQAIDPSAMRILWQLIKAEFAALVLLTGCVLAFRKRAGIVLLHAGVGLIMANELVVHFLHKEEQMRILQGRSANYAMDIRATELAVTESAGPKTESVVVFPQALLERSVQRDKIIEDKELPFKFKVANYFSNAEIEDGKPDGINPADVGIGRMQHIVEEKTATGSDSGDKVNLPAAYVEFFDKKDKSLGTYMLGVLVAPQRLKWGDKTYEVALRFERGYKPYTVKLDEVRGDMYMGTNVPRNYSSDIRIVDESRGVDRTAKIRMNEPLRYAGETLYQSGYSDGLLPDGSREPPSTTLQVVTNFGWMIPYVACMVIMTGMLAQFIMSLTRFLRRRSDSTGLEFGDRGARAPAGPMQKFWNALVPIGVVGLFVAVVVAACKPARLPSEKMDLVAAGKIPVVYGGRVQPLDSLARSTLRSLSSREVLVKPDETTEPAMVWLLDVIARPNVAAKHRVFRIDSPELRDALGLDVHPAKSMFGGSVQRYSPEELAAGMRATKMDFAKKVARISEQYKGKEKEIPTVDKKLMELAERGQFYQAVADSFHLSPELKSEVSEPVPIGFARYIEQALEKKGITIQMPDFPTKNAILKDQQKSLQAIQLWLDIGEWLREQGVGYDDFLRQSRPPLAIPTRESRDGQHDVHDPKQWEPFASAWLGGVEDLAAHKTPNEALRYWQEIIEAYASGDAPAFNEAVKDYTNSLAHDPPAQLERASPAFEAWFNAAGLFSLAQWFYFLAFCLVALFWMTGWKPLNWAAIGLLIAIFAVHTFALVGRMSISGRPPVTNLYSAGLFIGWAGVILGIVLELVYYRLGFGAAIAGLIGFATLIIADKLSLLVDAENRGDTIGVMRAVLDTQFWLSTHVTTVTLGYATTYIAGLLGLIYVIGGVFTHALTKDISKLLARMIYGSLCFAMFFSFFGTVLGGLWADDSWGRFWGWDPKENGALIIVLWNALALHARWDGMVKDRGLALLAIGGIIFTSWSFFGVNQLGVGLHSYGFTEGVLMWLGIVCAAALGLIALGALPTKYWLSGRELGTRAA